LVFLPHNWCGSIKMAALQLSAQMQKIKAEINKRTSDSRFFSTTKRGELHELREELNGNDVTKQKNAIKKVIANMTLGRDVSMVYADVVKLSRTSSLELKKLVYLYIMNNSRLQPDKAILAVNTFVTDCQHENPVVRALAIRTMLCIRVEEVLDYTLDPMKKAINDSDAYVRKTAALGVLKLYAAKPKLVEEYGLLDCLKGLLHDSSPMVVSNSVLAINEIQLLAQVNGNGSSVPMLELSNNLINKLLNALPECSEWGQIVILDFVATHYNSFGPKDVEMLLDRVVPRLSHLNHSIVLSSIRVLIKYLEFVTDDQKVSYLKKLGPPIVTLLNSYPELQYIVLRNIMVIIQKYPSLLAKDVKAFFCKYNDPQYVKIEKLTILLKLLNEKNCQMILLELKEYCSEIDVEFVQKSVKAIGFCALKIPSAAELCIDVLVDLIKARHQYLVNDCIIAMKDILRKYPGRFEGVIAVVCENLDAIDSVEAKQSLIWIIGEYAEKIDCPVDLLQLFIDNFEDEPTPVQLQILVATVKVFLKFPEGNDGLLQRMLRLCAEESENPDLRDRAYFYWRLLSNDGMIDKLGDIVLGKKPGLVSNEYNLPRALLEELLCNLNTLASTYHRMPHSFTITKPIPQDDGEDEDEEEEVEIVPIDSEGNELPPTPTSSSPMTYPGRQETVVSTPAPAPVPTAPAAPAASAVDPLDELFGGMPTNAPVPAPAINSLDDIFGTPMPAAPAPTTVPPAPAPTAGPVSGGVASMSTPAEVVLTPEKGNGLRITGAFVKTADNEFAIDFCFENTSAGVLSGHMIQINKNIYGISNNGPLGITAALAPGQRDQCRLALHRNAEKTQQKAIQMAVKNNAGIFYFAMQFPFQLAFTTTGYISDKKQFIQMWKSLPEENEVKVSVPYIRNPDVTAIQQVMAANNLFFVAKASKGGTQDNLYLSCCAFAQEPILMELVIQRGGGEHYCCVKGLQPEHVKPFEEAMCIILAR